MTQLPSPLLAEPFSDIFIDRAEADWAFDLLRDTARHLGIQGAYDPRFAMTLARRSGRLGLHLNFGGWLVIGFHGRSSKDLTGFKNLSGLPHRVDLALLAQSVSWDERFTSLPFARKESELEVRTYHLPLDMLRPMTSELQAAYAASLDFIAQKFAAWKRASHWKQHNPEIAEALFNPERRERLFAGLLTEPELRYERHLTAFYQDVSEEREEYEVEFEAEEIGEINYELQPSGGNMMYLNTQKVNQIITLLQQYRSNWSFADPFFMQDEIEYKQAVIVKAHELLSEAELKRLIEEDNFEEFVKRLVTIGQSSNLLFLGVPKSGDLNILYHPMLDKPTFCKTIFDLLYGVGLSPDRLERYVNHVQTEQLPNKWTFPTYFLFLCHPTTEMFVKPQTTKWFFEFIGHKDKFTASPTRSAYAALLEIAQQLKEALHDFGPRDMVDIQSIIWVCAGMSKTNKVHYWKIAPGENAWQWDECREGNFLAIGWEEVGDVSNMTKEEFDARLVQLGWTGKGAEQVWKFAQISEGDRVVANRGAREVLGIGTVTGSYYFVPEVRHGHRLPIRWDDLVPRQVEEPSWRQTVRELNFEKFTKIFNTLPIVLPPVIYSLSQLAEDTGLDEAELARWVRAIERKGQAILYGPPGTGKTFVAEKLAKHLIRGGDGFQELVQFHPAYAYEDFIQGIRPESQGDHLTYPNKPGRFLEFCTKAETRQDTCVLIIDEINRANLSRVFGELMYLLEYRRRSIPLAGGGTFTIPANVRLIGTMNTADRSIALVDHALRRRFAFIALYPNFDLLRRYHQRQTSGFPVEGLINLLRQVNQKIGDRHYEVGVTFFLRPDLSDEIEDIWRMEIEPYLEEYFFDRPEVVEEFGWDRIKTQLGRD